MGEIERWRADDGNDTLARGERRERRGLGMGAWGCT